MTAKKKINTSVCPKCGTRGVWMLNKRAKHADDHECPNCGHIWRASSINEEGEECEMS